MKKIVLSFLFIVCSFALIACQNRVDEMKLADNVTDISISKSNGYGSLNENYILSINQEESITVFESVLQKAKKISQDMDLTNEAPDYDLLISYENGGTRGLHLLLGNPGKESLIMYIGHEKKGYIVSPDETKKLRTLLLDV
ncbi:hypothetical protein CN378_05975 [Bacillus sp. AFS015802]|uniref:hypothetical protein n=1 Tax=Bacillus sp. AFS015802 TaxID=2033486 RepID=UPI000BF4E7A3|nr:hypothetical protein [Bacillus sp. AFS015802]PFA68753.1 hypothetical protein CN378_05975 [Bacillus sp. AFS015802]